MLYFTPTAIIDNNENPFHSKKSFIQDVEQYIEKEQLWFEKSQNISKQKKNL